MVGPTSACPQDRYVQGSAPRSASAVLWQLAQPGRARYLTVAAALQIVAFAIAAVTPGGAHQLIPILAGVALTIASLRLPRLEAAPTPLDCPSAAGAASMNEAIEVTSEPKSDLSHVASAPCALPFMGERILLQADHPGLTRLTQIASRLGRMPAARSRPWGELMARVSHELRTPLNAVIGFSDVMNAELFGPVGNPRYREYARHIRDCGRELLKSAEDTLAMTCLLDQQAPSTTTIPLDLGEIVHEAWNFYGDEAESRGIRLSTDMPPTVDLVAERRPMRQILINLFSEALRRSANDGVIGLMAHTDGDLVQLEVFVRGGPKLDDTGTASLAVCLARALLELQGAALVEIDDQGSSWRAVTVLRKAVQPDFFNSTAAFDHPAPTLC
jgi:signal transduction histidine kinase